MEVVFEIIKIMDLCACTKLLKTGHSRNYINQKLVIILVSKTINTIHYFQ